MIKCEREYLEVEHRARLLANKLDSMQSQKIVSKFEIGELKLRVQELRAELKDYHDLMMRKTLIKPPENMHEVPEYLMKRRLKTGLPQAELAKRLGIDRRQLHAYEKNTYRGMRLRMIIDLDRILSECERENPDIRFLESLAEAQSP